MCIIWFRVVQFTAAVKYISCVSIVCAMCIVDTNHRVHYRNTQSYLYTLFCQWTVFVRILVSKPYTYWRIICRYFSNMTQFVIRLNLKHVNLWLMTHHISSFNNQLIVLIWNTAAMLWLWFTVYDFVIDWSAAKIQQNHKIIHGCEILPHSRQECWWKELGEYFDKEKLRTTTAIEN